MLPSMAESLGTGYSCKRGVLWRWLRNLTSKVSKLLFTSTVLELLDTPLYYLHRQGSSSPNLLRLLKNWRWLCLLGSFTPFTKHSSNNTASCTSRPETWNSQKTTLNSKHTTEM
jgi:hypothetical protein